MINASSFMWRKPRVVNIDRVHLDEYSVEPLDKNALRAARNPLYNIEEMRRNWYQVAKHINVTNITYCTNRASRDARRGLLENIRNLLGGSRAHDPRSVRETIRAIVNEIHSRPENYELIKSFACFLQALVNEQRIRGNREVREGVEPRIMPLISEGLSNTVMNAALIDERQFTRAYMDDAFDIFKDAPDAFLLKMSFQPDFSDPGALNELLVAMFGLNALRQYIPSFMFVYGSFRSFSSLAAADDVDSIELFSGMGWTRYNMVETKNGITLFNEIMEHAHETGHILNLLAQIVLALWIAREYCDFSHNDLHTDNVIVQELDTVRLIEFRHGKNEIVLPVKKLATIIDFGRSHIRIPLTLDDAYYLVDDPRSAPFIEFDSETAYFHTGHISSHSGYTPVAPNSLSDIVQITTSMTMTLLFKAKKLRHELDSTQSFLARRRLNGVIKTYNAFVEILRPLFSPGAGEADILEWISLEKKYVPLNIDIHPLSFFSRAILPQLIEHGVDVFINEDVSFIKSKFPNAAPFKCGERECDAGPLAPVTRRGSVDEPENWAATISPDPATADFWRTMVDKMHDYAEIYRKSDIDDEKHDMIISELADMLAIEDKNGVITSPGEKSLLELYYKLF